MTDLQEAALPVVDVAQLDHAVAQWLDDATSGVRADPYRNFERFIEEAQAAVVQLPKKVSDAVTSFAGGDRAGSLLIRGLPIPDSIPPTPVTTSPETPVPVGSERLIASIGLLLGQPFSYEQWDRGFLVHNKYPLPDHRRIQFGSNAVEFLLHTETPFRDVSPDFLCLLCLRSDPSGLAMTLVSDLGRAIARLDEETREVLRRNAYAFETDNAVVEIDGRGLTLPHPILSDRTGTEVAEYVGDLVATGPAEATALGQLRHLIDEMTTEVGLQAGDMLILDNRRVVHGRSAFEPNYDGRDRWLQRMLFTTRPVVSPGRRLVSDTRYANYPKFYQDALRVPADGVL